MAVERLAIEDPLQRMHLVDQGLGLGKRQWRPWREELRLDPVEARLAVRPGIDGGIQRGEFDREDLRALIAGACIDPGLARPRDVARLHGCQHFVGIRHQAVDIRRAELLVGGRRLVELGLQSWILARLAFAGRVQFSEQDTGCAVLWATAVTGERRRPPADTASIKDAALTPNMNSDELPRCT